MKLLPWKTGWRSFRGDRRFAVLVAGLTALPIAVVFGAASLAQTASFSDSDIASMALGSNDLLARTTEDTSVPPAEMADRLRADGMRVNEDQDTTLAFRLPQGDDAELSVRFLSYAEPQMAGMVRFTRRSGQEPQLALTPTAADTLGAELGSTVRVRGSAGQLIDLTVTDLFIQPADTSMLWGMLNPESLDADHLDAVLDNAINIAPARLLVRAAPSSIDTAVGELSGAGYSVASRPGFVGSASNVLGGAFAWLVPALATVAAGLLAAGTTLAAQAGQRRNVTLYRLGASPWQAKASLSVQTTTAAGLGIPVGAGLGIGLTWLASRVLKSQVHQVWGPLDFDWAALGWSAAGSLGLTLAVALVVRPLRLPSARGRTLRARPAARFGLAAVTGWRSAASVKGATVAAGAAVAAVLGLAAAGVAVLGTAQAGQEASQPMPPGFVALDTQRPLTDTEAARVAAASNGMVVRWLEASWDDQPTYLETEFLRCTAKGDFQACAGATDSVIGRAAAIVSSKRSVEALIGRPLSKSEMAAYEHGDGLLLAGGNTEPVRLAGYAGPALDGLELAPKPVPGFEANHGLPGLVLSQERADQLGLGAGASGTTAKYYVVPDSQAAVNPAAVRSSLPSGLRRSAEIETFRASAVVANLGSIRLGVMLSGAAISVVALVLLMGAWIADSAPTLLVASRLGARSRWVAQAIAVRASISVLPACLCGIALGIWAGTAFLTHAYGKPVPMTFGLSALSPVLVLLVAVPTMSLWFAAESLRNADRQSTIGTEN
ncbi:MAG: hypothetical protein LBH76_04860, partial [Propionibacteriaceae bacterium]|nr:hypothetical protein [Propionibacteriaceae bacterium]